MSKKGVKMKEWLIRNGLRPRDDEENIGLDVGDSEQTWDYELDEKGQVTKMHNKLTGMTVTL